MNKNVGIGVWDKESVSEKLSCAVVEANAHRYGEDPSL